MAQIVKTARDVTGAVECPHCGEELGESNIRPGRYPNNATFRGCIGSLWVFVAAECSDCGKDFEVGGPIGLTSETP